MWQQGMRALALKAAGRRLVNCRMIHGCRAAGQQSDAQEWREMNRHRQPCISRCSTL